MDAQNLTGFDWDSGNWPKCGKHGVSQEEIESIFHGKVFVHPDPYPIEVEVRYNAVGQNTQGRYVFVVFTVREKEEGSFIRPLSARYMHRKEIEHYEQR